MKFPFSRRNPLFQVLLLMTLLIVPQSARSHPMPNSLVFLRPSEQHINAELQLPLAELQLAVPFDLSRSKKSLLNELKPQLEQYVFNHINLQTPDGKLWSTHILDMDVLEITDQSNYRELVVSLRLDPPQGYSVRDFELNYDAIIHQLVTHTAFVKVDQDWKNGVYNENPVEVGVIKTDVPTGTVPSLKINLDEGSNWKGFKSMLLLGMHHISDGTDHMLFLLVLLLPAPLLYQRKKWGGFRGTKYTFSRLLSIVTAFTIGHSITLLFGAWGWLVLPSKPVEILIAISILVSAIHAIRPIFPHREVYIAAGFGLVHGLAFAGILTNLDLSPERMSLSILGFNLGIELMQIFIVLCMVPSLLLFNKTPWFSYLRIIGAIIAGAASIAWIVERVSGSHNIIAQFVELCAGYAVHGVIALTILSMIGFLMSRIFYCQEGNLSQNT